MLGFQCDENIMINPFGRVPDVAVALLSADARELLIEGYVEAVGNKGQIFRVTHAGYEYADTLKNA